jgi:hypothetical protein
MSEEVVELRELNLDGGDGYVNLSPPLSECLVQIDEAHITEMFCNGHLIQMLDEGGFMNSEALLDLSAVQLHHLLNEKLDIRIQRTELVLLTARVVDEFQGSVGSRQLIPTVSGLGMPPTGRNRRRGRSRKEKNRVAVMQ